MPNCADTKATFKHSEDVNDCSAAGSSASTRSKRKAKHGLSGTANRDSSFAELDLANLCRYKTGRCTDTRVVKPNGSLLLLCEFHRSQQNRTKKRSDMKYRQDRAKKRMMERYHVRAKSSGKVLPAHPDQINDTTIDIAATESHRSKKSIRTRRGTRSDCLKAVADLFRQTGCEFSMASPWKEHDDDSLFVGSRSSPDSCGPSQRQFFSKRSIHSSVLEFDLEDANITIDWATVGSVGDVDTTSSVLPICVTPLSTARRSREPFWQPDDVRLLEYFIL